MKREYLSVTETAKLVRKALKDKFPGVKFSVRSDKYAGGASIRVRWTDGPTGKMVDAVAKMFAGGDFDGMIDMKYSYDSWLLPDGSACVASSPGTEGSMGVFPAVREWMPEPGSRLVRFGADFVFCDRDFSPEFYRRAASRAAEKNDIDPADLEFSEPSGYDGSIYCRNADKFRLDRGPGFYSLYNEIVAELSRRTNYAMKGA